MAASAASAALRCRPRSLSDERLAALEALTALRLLADDEVPPPTPVEPQATTEMWVR